MRVSVDILKDKSIVLFDGAMGTMLHSAGIGGGVLPETLNFSRPELIVDIHRRYIEAGADVITTNTFSGSRLKLEPLGLSPAQVMQKAAALARRAGARTIAADIGPSGLLMAPMGALTFEEAYRIFAEQARAAKEAGADMVLLETFSDLYEAKAALLAVKENTDLPVAVTMTFQQNGRTLMGSGPAEAVYVLEGLGADILGVNCSLGPEEILPIALEFLGTARVPVLVQPNAGLPRLEAGGAVFPAKPDTFARALIPFIMAGGAMLGGCCGTDPAFIRALSVKLKELKGPTPARKKPRLHPAAASARKVVYLDQGTTAVGERINPSGRAILAEAIKRGDYGPILTEAMDQKAAGAQILDINVYIPGLTEETLLPEVAAFLQSMLPIPLSLDSRDPSALAAAVRIVNGRPILNSVVCTKASMEAVFPLARKYGACLIGLTMDENGIPGRADERLAVARRLIEAAASYGIPMENMLIDCLATQARGPFSPIIALEAMRRVKTELGARTILGVSNVSYKHMNRCAMNSVYLAMAMVCGLDAAILDPTQTTVMETLRTALALTERTGSDLPLE